MSFLSKAWGGVKRVGTAMATGGLSEAAGYKGNNEKDTLSKVGNVIKGAFTDEQNKKTSGTSDQQTTYTPYDPTAAGALPGYRAATEKLTGGLTDTLQTGQTPYEQALYQANLAMLPATTAASIASQNKIVSDIKANAPVEAALRNQQLLDINASNPATQKFYQQATTGVSPLSRANMAEADVISAFKRGDEAWRRNVGSYGINPSSFGNAGLINEIEKAKGIAGARTLATTNAEQENFNRLLSAMGVRGAASGVNPSMSNITSMGGFQLGDKTNDILNAIITSGNLAKLGMTPSGISETGKYTGKATGSSTPSYWDIAKEAIPVFNKLIK